MTAEFNPGDYVMYRGRKLFISSRERKWPCVGITYDLCFCRVVDGHPFELGGEGIISVGHDAIERHLTEAEIVELKLKGLI